MSSFPSLFALLIRVDVVWKSRKYQSGGLNLNAGHFSQLSELFVFGFGLRLMGGLVVALMCLAQIAYQFYLYP